ncbi:MAG: chemotaxis protein CheW [Thermoanaerobacteraceae bacterium]
MSLYVVTKIENEEYAIKIDKVQTIEKVMTITRVPQTEEYVKGVINLRGEIIPVISLRKKLNFPEKDWDDDTRIVVLKSEDTVVGMIVDSANEVIDINDDSIDSLTFNDNKDEFSKYVAKVGKIGDRVFLILDLKKLLNVRM